MKNKSLIKLIKSVAEEQSYMVDDGDKKFSIDFDQWHSVAYEVSENSSGYIQANQWEYNYEADKWVLGRAVYSMRSPSDVIKFCSILINSRDIKAKR